MKKTTIGLMAIMALGLLLLSGCVSKEQRNCEKEGGTWDTYYKVCCPDKCDINEYPQYEWEDMERFLENHPECRNCYLI